MQARQPANSPMTPSSATAPSHSTPARVSVSGRFARVRSSFRARSWRATRATHPVRHGVGRSAPEGCRVSGANSLVGWSRLRLPRDTLSGDPGVDRQPGLYGGLSPSLALVHGSQAVNMATTCSIGSTTNAARATRAFATAADFGATKRDGQSIAAWSFVHAILAAVASAGTTKDPAQAPRARQERAFRPPCHAPATCADIVRRSSRGTTALRLAY